jgi:3'-phosphoadenosine 5'-phosphosulfate sulfotransferase (PAPS reductase)/FAD synthetase
MKKRPMHEYVKRTGRVQYLGTLADESKARQKAYVQYGCNAYDLKQPRSTPLAFWTEQDVLECLARFGIRYASVYGEIVIGAGGYECTGVHRTGCVFCCFGLHMDEGETRIQRLHRSHPKLWAYCMGKLGMAEVLNYMVERVPDRLKSRFKPVGSNEKQMGFFEEERR